jgi:hypothetical protein
VRPCSPDKTLTGRTGANIGGGGFPDKSMVQVNQHDLEFILRQIKIAEAN